MIRQIMETTIDHIKEQIPGIQIEGHASYHKIIQNNQEICRIFFTNVHLQIWTNPENDTSNVVRVDTHTLAKLDYANPRYHDLLITIIKTIMNKGPQITKGGDPKNEHVKLTVPHTENIRKPKGTLPI